MHEGQNVQGALVGCRMHCGNLQGALNFRQLLMHTWCQEMYPRVVL